MEFTVTLAATIRNWLGKGDAHARAAGKWQDGIALRDAGAATEARSCLQSALALWPGNAKWHNEFGLLCLAQGDPSAARAAFAAALAIDPRLAEAHCNLGMLLEQESTAAAGNRQQALAHFQRGAELDPDLLSAQYNAGLLLWRLGRVEEAIVCFDRAMALAPQSPAVLRDRGCVLQELARLEEAQDMFLRVLAQQPDHADARLSLALVRLSRGEFRAGWQDYEARYQTAESPRREYPVPDWDGDSLAEATLLIYAEQGLGDEILFASCVPDLAARAQHLVIDCEPRLSKLFARSFAQASVHGGARGADPGWLASVPTPSCKIAAGSVPRFLRNALDDFPERDRYLAADPARIAYWKNRLNDEFAVSPPAIRVGIAWRGGLPQTGNSARSLPLVDLVGALAMPGVHLVSLQHDATATELADAAALHGRRIPHWPEAHADYDETAALIMSLDLVVSVCSSVVHLAGALGQPAWVLTPFAPDWRFPAAGAGMPWHRSLRLVRQARRGDWGDALAGVGLDLAAKTGQPALASNSSGGPRTRRQLEDRIAGMPDDAGAHRELGELAMVEGDLETAIDSFELALHYRPRDQDALLALARALRAGGRLEEAEARGREAAAQVPDSLAARMELAAALKSQGRIADAVAEYRVALDDHPQEPALLCNLGLALHMNGEYAAAEQALRRALAWRPDFAEAHHNLGLALRESGDIEGAIGEFRLALQQGELIATRSALAHALRDLGCIDEALVHYDAALAKQPGFGDAELNRSLALLMRGDDARDDYRRGWDAYEQRFTAGRYAHRDFGFPSWEGQAGAGRGILVFGEQGLGDEIMFASCIPDLLARQPGCVIECNSRLSSLFARSFAAPVHGGAKADATDWVRAHPGLAWQISLGSLPRRFRRRAADFVRQPGAYLRADPARVAFWRQRFDESGAGRRVGLSWRGGNRQTRGALRSIELRRLAPLFAAAGTQFVSLQHGDVAGEIAGFAWNAGLTLRAWPGTGDDIDELAAMISALDLVVTIDNTVAHLAGALGKEVWILLPRGAEWRYGMEEGRMAWYPHARLFRQLSAAGWEPVIGRVADALGTPSGGRALE